MYQRRIGMRQITRCVNDRFPVIPLLLFTFFLVQTSFIPSAYSAPIPASSEPQAVPCPTEVLDYQLDSIRSEVTFVDEAAGSFGVFSAGSLEIPLAFGKVESREGERLLMPTREIAHFDDLYVLTNPADPNFLEVAERLPAGGFGRLLRYRGLTETGERVDLEFVYDDREGQVTILDHAAGQFYRTTFTEERPDPLSVFPRPDEKGWVGELVATQASTLKFIFAGLGFVGMAQPEIPWLQSQFEALSSQDVWTNRHVRGPPVGGLTP